MWRLPGITEMIDPVMTYRPGGRDFRGWILNWLVYRNGVYFCVTWTENAARHYCALPELEFGDDRYPDRLVKGPSGHMNPSNRPTGIGPRSISGH